MSNIKYLVAYTHGDIDQPNGSSSDYTVYIDDDAKERAQELYDELLKDADLHSAAICEIVYSTEATYMPDHKITKEIRVCLLECNYEPVGFTGDNFDVRRLSDAEFLKHAEDGGEVCDLQEFQCKFNDEAVSSTMQYIRFIEVSVSIVENHCVVPVMELAQALAEEAVLIYFSTEDMKLSDDMEMDDLVYAGVYEEGDDKKYTEGAQEYYDQSYRYYAEMIESMRMQQVENIRQFCIDAIITKIRATFKTPDETLLFDDEGFEDEAGNDLEGVGVDEENDEVVVLFGGGDHYPVHQLAVQDAIEVWRLMEK